MADDPNKRRIGKDAVVVGNVSADSIGDGSVVIGPTDNRGNTVINTPMAVGRDAKAGPGSIAIGAGANAGGSTKDQTTVMELLKNFHVIAALLLFFAKVALWWRGEGSL
jgi:hypothetical protein